MEKTTKRFIRLGFFETAMVKEEFEYIEIDQYGDNLAAYYRQKGTCGLIPNGAFIVRPAKRGGVLMPYIKKVSDKWL